MDVCDIPWYILKLELSFNLLFNNNYWLENESIFICLENLVYKLHLKNSIKWT